MYYDTVYLDFYLRALQNNGNPTYFNFTFAPATVGSPALPTLGSLPPGTVLPRSRV